MRAFQTMIEAFFDRNQAPLFGPEILYVPGNHDHRHWQIVRDEVDLISLKREPDREGFPEPMVTTPLFSDNLPISQVVTTLARRPRGTPISSSAAVIPMSAFVPTISGS